MTYRLGERAVSLDELERAQLLTSEAALLGDFGFEWCHVHDGPDATDLMLDVAREQLAAASVDKKDVAALFVYSGLPAARPSDEESPLSLFRYDLGRIRYELEFDEVPSYRLSQLGCCGLMATIALADAAMRSSEGSHALVLVGDCFGPHAHREIMYNIMSDAAAALLMDRSSTRNRVLASSEIVQAYYWDTPAHPDEILASYFPLAQRAIEKVLAEAGASLEGLRWIVPHNVSRRSWEVLCDMLDVDEEKVWLSNIPRVGHTVTSDHVINLKDMESAGVLERGDRLLLFTFGFGATWSATIVEH